MNQPLISAEPHQASHWSAFDAEGIGRLVAIEDRHFWFRARNEILAALVEVPINRLPPHSRILEVGCGSGNVLRVLKALAPPDISIEGLEPSHPAAQVAHKRTGFKITTAELKSLPRTAPFDIIAAFDVLEHISAEVSFLQEAYSRLSQQGKLILTVPAHPSLWSNFDVASGHMRRYTPKSLETSLAQASFKIEFITPIMSILLPLLWARRKFLMPSKASLAATIDGEFRIVPFANGVAYAILRQEAKLIKRHQPLPFGASLAVIATKAIPRSSNDKLRSISFEE